MRTFYIFNIKKELSIILKDNPYNLFKTIDHLYYSDNVDYGISFELFDNIFNKYNKEYIDKKIYNCFKDNRFYSYNIKSDLHEIINKYIPENTKLKVRKNYILIKTDIIKPTLLFNYLMNDNLFVCDFKNKDYFWLNEFVR